MSCARPPRSSSSSASASRAARKQPLLAAAAPTPLRSRSLAARTQCPSPVPAPTPPALSPRQRQLPAPQVVGAADDDEEARVFFEAIDADRGGSISRLELIDAVYRDERIADFVLQGLRPSTPRGGAAALGDEQRYDLVDSVFAAMGGGRQRVAPADFAAHFRRTRAEHAAPAANEREMQHVYALADADGNGSISKLELLSAMQRDARVAEFLAPGLDCRELLRDECAFDAASALFDSIAGGKRRIEQADFEAHYRKTHHSCTHWRASTDRPRHPPADREGKRVLVVGHGFGLDMNLRQAHVMQRSGFDVRWWQGTPEDVQLLRRDIAEVQPHVLVCASAGGSLVVDLWSRGLWGGPTLMINAHPLLRRLPPGVPVVLAHGANDDCFRRPRVELEEIMATGSENRCMLYYTGNSGEISPGAHTRLGDGHQMHSLTLHDCLPRLLDAAVAAATCAEGPEQHVVRSWRRRLSDARLEAEHWLGYTTERLRSRWASPGRRGADAARRLYEVPRDGQEFARVAAVFRAAPREPSDYELGPAAAWEQRTAVVRVERVENGAQEAGSARPYFQSLHKVFQAQGLTFEPGVHTCWAWHGTCAGQSVLDSICSNPAAGFQPLTTGSRNKPLWGPGAYFARDAQYVAEGQFCGPAARDGTRQMLLCLLTIGMPCVGDPAHIGVLPHRRKPHRYHASVDCLSNPEIFALQHPGAAYPAYVVTFA